MTRQEQLNEAWCKYMGKCSTEIIQALAFALRWCDEHPNWISVEEELPPIREIGRSDIVLVCTAEETIGIAYYNHVNKAWVSSATRNVTHWMSMPQVPLKKETKWTEHTLQRDKDGFLVGEVSDLDVYLPFEVHDNKYDTWEVIEDDSALVDWSGDIDTKPRYDRIRTMEQVVYNKKEKGGKQ